MFFNELAQFVLGPVYPGTYGGKYGLTFGGPGHHHGPRVVGFAGGFYSPYAFVAPPLLPVLPPVSMWTPFGWTPGFIGPGWGAGPGLLSPPAAATRSGPARRG